MLRIAFTFVGVVLLYLIIFSAFGNIEIKTTGQPTIDRLQKDLGTCQTSLAETEEKAAPVCNCNCNCGWATSAVQILGVFACFVCGYWIAKWGRPVKKEQLKQKPAGQKTGLLSWIFK